ncbi:MAG: site-specific DNA-methyltransferase, partial [Rhodobacteraceae bacterium]|nr:site-specific DNA-methyltransferase [Paracoccaceae bacterium]
SIARRMLCRWRQEEAAQFVEVEIVDGEVAPSRMVRDAILDVTAMVEVVLDPFLGSGTTIPAAELSKRVCVGIEISPAYVDVAIGRWEEMTGLEAVHEETGLTCAELRQSRSFASGSSLN